MREAIATSTTPISAENGRGGIRWAAHAMSGLDSTRGRIASAS